VEFLTPLVGSEYDRNGKRRATPTDGLFGKVNDTIREAALMAAGRKLSAEALAETCRAGLKEIFG
jgi:hypothetical protein